MEGAILDESRAFAAAAAAAARLDVSVSASDAAADLYFPAAMRREAMSIAAMEGFLVRPEYLAKSLGDRAQSSQVRGSRLAAAVHDGLSAVCAWTDDGPSQGEAVAFFSICDAASGRLIRPDVQWSIEEDAQWLSDTLCSFAETADPWTALETVRVIWTSGRFFGASRRIAAVAAPWVLKRGFACANPLFGAGREFTRNPDGFRDNAHDKGEWGVILAASLSEAFAAELSCLADGLASRTAILALCPPGRTSSSIEAAVAFAFRRPAFTAKDLCDGIGLTARGGKVVLDKLVSSGVLSVEGGSRNRTYLCRRTM